VLAIAWHNVRREPGRSAALALAIALPVLLVLVISGVYLGLLDAMVAFPRTLPGDLIVTEAGASPIFMRSTSRIPLATVDAVRAVPGVAAVEALHGRLVWVERDGQRGLVYLMGIDPAATFGVPPAVVAGQPRPDELDEIILDRALVEELRLPLRTSFRVAGARFRLAGVADGGNSVIGTFAWANRNALALAGVSDASHLFVRVAPGADVAAVRERVARIRGVDVYTRPQFDGEIVSMARQFYRPVIGVVAGITALVGALVLGLALWVSAVERRTEHALLRALGIPRRRVYAIVLWQAAIVAAIGVLLGVAGGLGAATGIARLVPRFVVLIPWWLVALSAAGAAGVGLAASWLPVRAVARTDPALVFRA
jgi:putative ABC transport system permease protein